MVKILVSFRLSISIPAEYLEISSGLSFFATSQFTVCNENALHSFKIQITAVRYLKRNKMEGYKLDSYGSEYGPVADSYEYGNELLASQGLCCVEKVI